MATDHNIQLALDRLSESGLTAADAKALHIDVWDASEVQASGITGWSCPAMVLNYMDPWHPGHELRPRPKHPAFKRLRFLGTPPLGADNKPIRYAQAAGSGVCAYFPSTVDWLSLRSDPDRAVLITEGELKAAKASAMGFPTIGLGGVANFLNTSMGIGFLRELEGMDWVGRRVFICFDNDGKPKPEVCASMHRLAKELEERGAIALSVMLPAVDGLKKTGLDDYLTHNPEREKFITLLEQAEFINLANPLWEMNAKCAVILDPPMVVNIETGRLMNPESFKKVIFATHSVPEQRVQADGSISMKRVPVAPLWMAWPLRSQLSNVTYAPGKPRIEAGQWNAWEGWGARPVEGDVEPFERLIGYAFGNVSMAVKTWFLRWLAYPIQKPGTKLFTAAVLHGPTQGTGKSFIGYSMGQIYGRNFAEIKQRQLFSDFNAWAHNKQFILGDDVTGSDKREVADMLKNMITSRELTINEKFMPAYTVPDCVNYLFTSNQPDAFYLEDSDRRFFIHEMPSTPMDPVFYREVYDPWIYSEAGRNALMAMLLDLGLGDFDHRSRALVTDSKLAMIDAGRSDLGAWCAKLRDYPDDVLKLGQVKLTKDLFSSEELRNLYDPGHQHKITANAVARNLKQIGFHQVMKGCPVTLKGRPGGRFFIVRNLEHWLAANAAQVRAHLEK